MPRGSRLLTRALVATLLLGVPLAACAPGGPDRGPAASAGTTTTAPTVSATATPSPTPTAFPSLGPLPDGVAPARPAALDQPPTLDGAKAVATYFVLMYSYAYQTGDLTVWNSLSDPQCVFCGSVRSNAESARALGQHLVGGAMSVTSTTGTEVTIGKFFDLTLSLNEAPSKTVDRSGTSVRETSGGDLKANIIVIHDGSWRVRELSTKVRATA